MEQAFDYHLRFNDTAQRQHWGFSEVEPRGSAKKSTLRFRSIE
jgi:hypothetical protein